MPGSRGKGRIIVALDVSTLGEAEQLIKLLKPHVGIFKVGLELICAEGLPRVLEFMHQQGARVFADVKLHDIPTTVGKASANIAKLGAGWFNVHASGGIDMMKAAVANRMAGKLPSNVLAVTVLTSLKEDVAHLIYGLPSKAKVLQLAKDAKMAGVQGIICSPKELILLKSQSELGGLDFVTPGIRPEWAAKGDQARITTPYQAVKDGAEFIVVGRPITDPPAGIDGPVVAAQKITIEIEAAEKELGLKNEEEEKEPDVGSE